MRQILKSYETEPVHVDYAIRILDAFEQADQNKAALPELVRIAGSLANRPVGVNSPDGLSLAEHSPARSSWPPEPAMAAPATMRRDFGPSDSPLGTVWMHNASQADAYQVLILDRLAARAEVVLLRSIGTAGPSAADVRPKTARLVASLTGVGASAEQRIATAAQLGLGAHQVIVVLALFATSSAELALVPADWPQFHTERGGILVVLRAEDAGGVSASGLRCGVGHPVSIADARASLESAELALQFTAVRGPGRRRYRAEDLGALIHLAHVPTATLERDADVRKVAAVAGGIGGAESLALLEEVVWSKSLRSVAVSLNYHHSSVSQRVNRLEAALGLSLAEPAARLRAQSALLGWRQLEHRRAGEHA